MGSVFYAWQSDRPNRINRGLVKEALEDAIRRLNADLVVDEALELDSDTLDVPGIPPVADTIMRKIRECRVFVADVSFIGSTDVTTDRVDEEVKLLPNSNVMIELGYALGQLGDGKIVLAMNTHWGMPKALPFDLAHRRHPIRYSLQLDADGATRSRVRKELSGDFERAIRMVLRSDSSSGAIAAVDQRDETPDDSYFAISRSIMDHGATRFAECVVRDSVDLPLHGSFEAAMYIPPANTLHADRNFLELVTGATPRLRDLPLWFNFQATNEHSVKPQMRGGEWEAAVILLNPVKWAFPLVDFWLASPSGRFYQRRGFWEDIPPNPGPPPYPPRTTFDITYHLDFVAEALTMGQSLARAMGLKDDGPHIEFSFRWMDLAERLLVSSKHPTLDIRQLRATDDDKVTGCFLPVAGNRQDILNCVEEACRSVANSFDGFPLSPEWVARLVNPFLDGGER